MNLHIDGDGGVEPTDGKFASFFRPKRGQIVFSETSDRKLIDDFLSKCGKVTMMVVLTGTAVLACLLLL